MMKKLISLLTALMLLMTCCAAWADAIEMGTDGRQELDFEAGNYRAVAIDGSVHAKIYVGDTWTPETEDLEHAGEAVTAMWYRGADEDFQTLLCHFYTFEDFGTDTPEEMLAILRDMDFEGDVFTVNGIPTVLFHTEYKDLLGGFYRLENGWLDITVGNITSEDLENEAMLMLCSVTDAE